MFKLVYKNSVNLKRCPMKILTTYHFSTVKADSVEPAKNTGDSQETGKEFDIYQGLPPKPIAKKPQRPPFAKNLFLGKFDYDVLTYPELQKSHVDKLESKIKSLSELFKSKLSLNKSVKEFLKGLGSHRLIGLRSKLRGGRQLTVTESCRFAQVVSEYKYKNQVITNEKLGIQTLQEFGSEQQKQKYMEKLISGSLITAFATNDKNPRTITKATPSADGKSYEISGEKICVLNGCSGDLLIVFAETNRKEAHGIEETEISAFLIDGNTPGVVRDKCNVISPNLEVSNIKFDQVSVPLENMIGRPGDGSKIMEDVLTDFRINCGPLCIATTKKLLQKFVEHCIENSTEELPLYETEAVARIIGEIVVSIYAMESITYLTTGLLDQYENQDCTLEAAIVKAFCARHTFKATSSVIGFLGTPALAENHWCFNLHMDALNYLVLQESVDNLELYIALKGLQHAGKESAETIKMLRNPLYHSAFVLKKMFTSRRDFNDNPKLNLGLEFHIHPSLMNSARSLEYCVLRLKFATEILLTKYGIESVNKHMHLKRLCECVLDIYALTACLGRASRSYCIGLRDGNKEMMIAASLAIAAKNRVKDRVMEMILNEHYLNDENYKEISQDVIKHKGYFPTHPLTRNF